MVCVRETAGVIAEASRAWSRGRRRDLGRWWWHWGQTRTLGAIALNQDVN